jgi:hypothetical protein
MIIFLIQTFANSTLLSASSLQKLLVLIRNILDPSLLVYFPETVLKFMNLVNLFSFYLQISLFRLPILSKIEYCLTCFSYYSNEEKLHATCFKGKKSTLFLYDFTKLLEMKLKTKEFKENIKIGLNRKKELNGKISDIQDGRIYQYVKSMKKFSLKNTLTFSLFIDGISIYNTSNLSSFPM